MRLENRYQEYMFKQREKKIKSVDKTREEKMMKLEQRTLSLSKEVENLREKLKLQEKAYAELQTSYQERSHQCRQYERLYNNRRSSVDSQNREDNSIIQPLVPVESHDPEPQLKIPVDRDGFLTSDEPLADDRSTMAEPLDSLLRIRKGSIQERPLSRLSSGNKERTGYSFESSGRDVLADRLKTSIPKAIDPLNKPNIMVPSRRSSDVMSLSRIGREDASIVSRLSSGNRISTRWVRHL
jgi:hypothetical protein